MIKQIAHIVKIIKENNCGYHSYGNDKHMLSTVWWYEVAVVLMFTTSVSVEVNSMLLKLLLLLKLNLQWSCIHTRFVDDCNQGFGSPG